MKVSLFLASWFYSLLIGLVLSGVVTESLMFGALFAVVSAVLSAPFIIIFSILMSLYLKKKPSTSDLHVRTFALHAAGSFLTVLVLVLLNGGFPFELYAAICGYFVIDSLFFHTFIQLRNEEGSSEKVDTDNDILDSPL